MNCKFCGNFVPEGKDSCPVCGRRPEEEPVGKLLSDNQPGAAAKVEALPEAAPEKRQRHPKGLFLPLIMIALSVAGWVYALYPNGWNSFLTKVSSITGLGTDLASNTDFSIGGAVKSGEISGSLVTICLAVVVSLIGVWGVLVLCRRVYNRVKFSD